MNMLRSAFVFGVIDKWKNKDMVWAKQLKQKENNYTQRLYWTVVKIDLELMRN